MDIDSREYRLAALAINFDLEALFTKNLDFFSVSNPALFDAMRYYKPQTLQLSLSTQGYLNLYNLNTGQAVYPTNPEEYAKKQADLFLKLRPGFSMHLSMEDAQRDDYPYSKMMLKLGNRYQSFKYKQVKNNDRPVEQLFMFGGGLFLQLQHVLNAIDVKNLTIFEPSSDAFHASMHLIDWSEIFRYFDRKGYSLELHILGDDSKNLRLLVDKIERKGHHRFPRLERYVHYNNHELDSIVKEFTNLLNSAISSVGFFEDERIGLAHTVENLKNKIPYSNKFLSAEKNFDNIPVFIIGNGPSLDESEQFLTENQDKAIIISCGSALSALLAKGIKPDIHVEQERMLLTASWIESSTFSAQLKNIVLVAMNPCHPKLFTLFDKSYMAIKCGDLGASFMQDIGCDDLNVHEYTHPIAANFGLSVALSLGFNNLHFFGIDCGMVDPEYHHSKDSGYYNHDSENVKNIEKSIFLMGKNEVVGNLRQFVTTTPLLNMSRIQLEGLLKKYTPQCYNLSDGALINGAKPLKFNALILPALQVNKSIFVQDRLALCYKERDIAFDLIEAKVKKVESYSYSTLCEIENLLCITELDLNQVLENFDKVVRVLHMLKVHQPIVYYLLFGSLHGLMLKLSVAKYKLTEEDFNQYYSESKSDIDLFITEVKDQIEFGMLNYDKF